MAMMLKAGVSPAAVTDEDDGHKALALRQKIVTCNRFWIQGLCDDERQRVVMQVRAEMQDDPHWIHRGKWNWEKYHSYAALPSVFATYFSIAGFVRLEGYGVQVLQRRPADGTLYEAYSELPAGGYEPIQVVREGVHYDLFVADPVLASSPSRRLSGKRSLCGLAGNCSPKKAPRTM